MAGLSFLGLGFPVSVLLLAACGPVPSATNGPSVPATPGAEDTSASAQATDVPVKESSPAPSRASTPGSTSGASVAHVPTPTPEPPARERVRIHNSCAKPMKFHIERVNDSDLESTITNQNEIEERAKDGDEVRLIGENNAVLHVLKIEPSTKVVDVAQSCTKLEAKQ